MQLYTGCTLLSRTRLCLHHQQEYLKGLCHEGIAVFVFFFNSTIDLIHDTRHLCMHSRTDGTKARSRGFSGGKQVKKLPVEEIVVEFVDSRQQETKTFSS